MLTDAEIAGAAIRSSVETLPPSLRREIDRALLDRDPPNIQQVFEKHSLASRQISRSAFYRYAQKLRLLQTAADLNALIGENGPTRESLFQGIQNGLLFKLAESVHEEDSDHKLIRSLTQSLKSLVTTDIALQTHASRSTNRTGRASAGPVSAHQPATPDATPSTRTPEPATPDVSPSTTATNSPPLPNPYHLPDYFETERFPIEKLDPDNWHPIAAETYVDLWEFQKKMCIEQELIPPECANLPAPDPQSILELPVLPPEALEQKQFRDRFAPLTTPDGFYIVYREPDNLKPRFKKIEEKEANWGRHSDGTPMMHGEFYADFREICYHRFPGLFPEPTDDEKAELKKNPSYWLWSRDPMRRAHPYGRKPDGTPRNHDEYQAEIDARSNPFQDRITQPPSRLLNGPNRTGRASAGPERAQQPATPDDSPSTPAPVRTPIASSGREDQRSPAACNVSPNPTPQSPRQGGGASPDPAQPLTNSPSNYETNLRASVPCSSDTPNPIPDIPNREPGNPLANRDSRPSSLGKYTTGGHEP